jgi:hypothetical protein
VLNAKLGLHIPHDPSVCNLAEAVFDFSEMHLVEEQIEAPGVTTKRLCVSAAQDQVELIEVQRIEAGLEGDGPLMTHLLPTEFGGQLEKVLYLVDQRISQATSAGLSTSSAALYLGLAQQELADAIYRKAYSRAATAYKPLVTAGP